MKVARYWKAIVAGAVAGSSAAATALQDGQLTPVEVVTIVVAVVGGLGLTWAVPNRQKPPMRTVTPEA